MGYYLISYDLRTPGKDYTNLYASIKQISPNWQHPLESTWLLYTDLTANEIYNRIHMHLDANDRIFIIRVREEDKQGWLSKSFWDWINTQRDL